MSQILDAQINRSADRRQIVSVDCDSTSIAFAQAQKLRPSCHSVFLVTRLVLPTPMAWHLLPPRQLPPQLVQTPLAA
jgi:hypothetical protein